MRPSPPPPPPHTCFPLYFSSLGRRSRSWCFINSFLLFTLVRFSDRVCKNWQRIKENTAAVAEDFCFVSCYFCKVHRLSEMSKQWRSRKQPLQRLAGHGCFLKPFFFHPFLTKKKHEIILFSKLDPQNFWQHVYYFCLNFDWKDKLLAVSTLNKPYGWTVKGDCSRFQKY